MKTERSRRRFHLGDERPGFTLVELLLALMATSLILGAAYAALFSGLNSYQMSSYKAEILTVLNRSLARMFEDLTAACVGAETFRFQVTSEIREIEGLGEFPNDRLLFTAAIAKTDWTDKPQSDLSEVEYYIDADEETPARWLVRRTETPPNSNPKEGGEIHLIGPRVEGMDVLLFNGTQWVDEWDSSTELPQAVRITLFILPSSEAVSPRRIEQLSSTVWIPRSTGGASGGSTGTEAKPTESGAKPTQSGTKPAQPKPTPAGQDTTITVERPL
jgi:type II secretion system protein J